MYPHVHCSIIYKGQNMEATEMCTDGGASDKDVVCIKMKYYSAIKKIAICDKMNESQRHYTKWNKSDRKREIPYDLIY